SVCCAGAGAIRCLCCVIPCKTSTTTRLMYTLNFVIAAILAWALSHWGAEIADPAGALTQECDGACFEFLAVYRVSLSMVIYHGALCLLTIGVSSSRDVRGVIHNGYWCRGWPIKFLIWLAILVAMFFIPAEKLAKYWIAAIVFSALFILLQSYILVDFGWSWSETWVSKWESTGNNFYKFLLIFFSAAKYSAVIAVTVLLYIFFTTKPGCGLNIFYITLNLFLCILITALSISPRVQRANPRAGLFQAAVLSVYCTYVMASAVGSEPNDQNFSCSPKDPNDTEEDALRKATVYVGIAITFLALGYSALSAGSVVLWSRLNAESPSISGSGDPDDESDGITYSYAFFHFVFVLANMYMASVMTNWSKLSQNTTSTGTSDDFSVNTGFVSVWVKVATGWACFLLYGWTLVAPLIFPDRDFGV
ncbi:serine incorporator/TMS membrane protein, partial [Fimicolochytrium jonesii]|uniref:serine incorporator/TMS membrane protein n=1 Tax=Fimicolochytrium jonesii TaxID=1396493 RepID=UPI0022FF310B